ncbi:MAG: hypothetical protein WCD07_06355 [Burkholderiales bacterium]
MERDKHFTTGVLAITWVAMLAILLTAFFLYPRGFLPALEFLGFPFILANIFLLMRLARPKTPENRRGLSREQFALQHYLPQVQYNDLATFRPKNPVANIYAARRRAHAVRM